MRVVLSCMKVDPSEVIDIDFVQPVRNSLMKQSAKDVTKDHAALSSKGSNAFVCSVFTPLSSCMSVSSCRYL